MYVFLITVYTPICIKENTETYNVDLRLKILKCALYNVLGTVDASQANLMHA